MNLKILASSRAHLLEIHNVAMRPEFRKATRNMSLATVALEKALQPILPCFEKHRERFGLILSSASGELETTLDFLKTWQTSKLARPLLFQNSLHNATAGFLSIHFQITGPVLTVCGSDGGTEQALESAQSLLAGGLCDACFVLSVEVWPRLRGLAQIESEDVDGAACLILSTPETAAFFGVEPNATLATGAHRAHQLQKQDLWTPQPLAQNSLYQMALALETGSLQTPIHQEQKSL